MAKPSTIDEYIVELNRDNYNDKKWRAEGIATPLSYEDCKEKLKKDFNVKYIEAGRPPGSRFQAQYLLRISSYIIVIFCYTFFSWLITQVVLNVRHMIYTVLILTY